MSQGRASNADRRSALKPSSQAHQPAYAMASNEGAANPLQNILPETLATLINLAEAAQATPKAASAPRRAHCRANARAHTGGRGSNVPSPGCKRKKRPHT